MTRLFIILLILTCIYPIAGQTHLSENEFKHQVKLSEQLAQRGNVDSMLDLGYLYYNGYTKNDKEINDLRKSYFWFEKAAFKKHNVAMFNLGYFFEQGLNVRVDLKKAIRWYESSAKTGNPLSMFKLVKIYKNQENKNYNLNKASHWTTIFFESTKGFYESIQENQTNEVEIYRQYFSQFGIINSELLLNIEMFKMN